ncbi:hypothetical protein GCM10009733_002200 [Nonomuraea maheshkhaliensis]|uniref:Uncharacterized protein n=1 Tax=Nonomuraea maheshkhaliensis TaxID=419590 RepID=A0ABN2EML8_9ACTN
MSAGTASTITSVRSKTTGRLKNLGIRPIFRKIRAMRTVNTISHDFWVELGRFPPSAAPPDPRHSPSAAAPDPRHSRRAVAAVTSAPRRGQRVEGLA